MKKFKLTFFFITLLFIGLSTSSCDDDNGDNNIVNEEEVKVESVEWKSDLQNGFELSLNDKSMNVANRMDILPKNATNQKQTYSSSNLGVATISDKGQVTPIALGTTTITVTVDDITAQFELKVVQVKIVNVTSISIAEKDIAIEVNKTENLATRVSVIPSNATNKAVTYESSAPSLVSVNDLGVITGLQTGTATITVKSVDNPSVTGVFNITVKEASFKGDYARDNWTLTASHKLFVEGTNSLASPFDGDASTWFALVRPGRTYKDVSVPAADGIYFVVDMKVAQPVNYFKIRHRNETQLFLRYRMIEEISGSNDGINFTSVAKDVAVTDYQIAEMLSPKIKFTEANYRYLKFYCKKDACFDATQGASAQMAEFYLGIE